MKSIGIALLLCLVVVFSARAAVLGPLELTVPTGPLPGPTPNVPTITTNPWTGYPGSQAMINGRGYLPGGYLGSILWGGGLVREFNIPAGGSFAETITIPANASPGWHDIEVCSGNPCFTFEFEQRDRAGFLVKARPINYLPLVLN